MPNFDKIIIFTGAGISAESGVPTFRDSGGLWDQYDINDVCNFNTWEKNFDLVHEFYNKRRSELNTVSPNHTHDMIAKWEKKYPDVYNYTCNVDDLLERAGCSHVRHLHGYVKEIKCTECNRISDIGTSIFLEESHGNHLHDDSCRFKSHNKMKPNVVFFHEMAPAYNGYYDTLSNVLDNRTIVIVMGTSGSVVNIQFDLKGKPGYTILNNLDPSFEMFSNTGFWTEELYMKSTKAVDIIDDHLKFLMGY